MSNLTIIAHRNTLAGTRDGGRGPEYAPPAPGHPCRWRLVPGLHDRFEVSDTGLVRRARHTGKGGRGAGTLVATARGRHGYVKFHTTIDGKPKSLRVHRMVILAFVGPIPPGMEVAHLNGCRTDNRLENLAVVTPAVNTSHKDLHGTVLRGEAVGGSKLSAVAIAAIRCSKDRVADLARRYRISRSHVYRIRNAERWRHLSSRES